MLTLYYSPGSCSLAAHIALREAELEHSLNVIHTRKGEHRSQAYAEVNPLKRIPTLITHSQQKLTEVPAILWYIASRAPARHLLPEAPSEIPKAVEWMSLLTSGVHPPFSLFFYPPRWFSNESLYPDIKKDCHAHFWEMLQHVESRLPDSGWVLSEEFSLCDPYVALFYWWGLRTGLPVAELPRYRSLASSVRSRPATQKALEIEGLTEAIPLEA